MSKLTYLTGGIFIVIVMLAVIAVYIFQTKSEDVTLLEDETIQETPSDQALTTSNKRELKVLFKNVEGDVQLIRGDEIIEVTEEMETLFEPDDRITTGKNGSASIYFHDETSVHLDPASEIKMIYWARDESKDHIAFQHVHGLILNDIKTGDEYRVLLGEDFVDVKGTLFLTFHDENRTSLTVLGGVVQLLEGMRDSDYSPDYQMDVRFPRVLPSLEVLRNAETGEYSVEFFDVENLVSMMGRNTLLNVINSINNNMRKLLREETINPEEYLWIEAFGDEVTKQNKLLEEEIQILEEVLSTARTVMASADEFNREDSSLAQILEQLKERADEVNDERYKNVLEHRVQQMKEILQRERLAEQLKERLKAEQAEKRRQAEQTKEERRKQLMEEYTRNRQEEMRQQRQEIDHERQREDRPPRSNENTNRPAEKELMEFTFEPIANQSITIGNKLHIPIEIQPIDAQMKVTSSNSNIATVDIVDNQLYVEAFREGKVNIKLDIQKDGYKNRTFTFDVTVTATGMLPLDKSVFIPQNKVLQFENGVEVDLTGHETKGLEKILVQEIIPSIPSTMNQAGKVVNITFEDFEINKPVRLVLPYDQSFAEDQIGVFHKEDDRSWRYIPFIKTEQGLELFATDFSQFGVFTAPKLEKPTASETAGELPVHTFVYLETIEGADIYYTTNGETPTDQSLLYREPILMDENMTIKAIAMANHYLPSEVASFDYTIHKEYKIAFTVTDGENPLADAVVIVHDHESMTDRNGHVEFSLPNGTYEYVIEAPGYVSATGSIEVVGHDIEEKVTLERKKHEVTFGIDDGINPVVGAKVTIDELEKTTNSEGEIKFELPNGTYSYRVDAAGYDIVYGTFEVINKSFMETISLNLVKHEVNFTVLFDGNPINKAEIHVGNLIGVTDEQGQVSFHLQNGTYDYSIEVPGYETKEGTIEVLNKDLSEKIYLTIEKHRVAIIVTDSEKPIADAIVTINDEQLVTNHDGYVELLLPNGTYHYNIVADSYEELNGSLEVSDESVDETVTMNIITHEVTFNVLFKGIPIADAEVSIGSNKEITDKHGKVSFQLPKGIYHYTIVASGYESVEGTINVTDRSIEETIHLEQKNYDVTFVVSDEGNRVGGVSVTFNDQVKLTDNDGTVRYSVREGTYEYVIEALGYRTIVDRIEVSDKSEEIIKQISLTAAVDYGNVQFNVTNGMFPVPNAIVTVNGLSKSVSMNGEVSFYLPRGIYEYNVQAPGYPDFVSQFEFSGGEIDTMDVILETAFHHVIFTVTEDGEPIEDFELFLEDILGQSDRNGQIIFTVPAGTYQFEITNEGYEGIEGIVVVTDNDVHIPIELRDLLDVLDELERNIH